MPAGNATSTEKAGRSVVDYVDDSELREALKTVTPQGIAGNDWILPVPDPEADEQTVEGELARLRDLHSFFLLDAAPDPAFDELTEEARQIFGVPTSLISLIDLGRQFLFSNTGADVRETARDVAFCSHTILNKEGMVVVEDTKLDARFANNPLVTQEPHLRFYAGAPLISPDGYKLGTFCVEGPQPRAFSEDEKVKLKNYAAQAMELMVQRRKRLRDRLSLTLDKNAAQTPTWYMRHAAVTTNLGNAMFSNGDSLTAMQLFQESAQTILRQNPSPPPSPTHADEGKEELKPQGSSKEDSPQDMTPQDEERHNRMVDLLKRINNCTASSSSSSSPDDDSTKKEIMVEVKGLFPSSPLASSSLGEDPAPGTTPLHPHDGIPGLFNTVTKLKGVSAPRPLPPLVFDETFLIDMSGTKENVEGEDNFPVDERPFTVSMGECSKATLFNMGLVHYHWCRPDTAIQCFHLAASVSHKCSPLTFDPVDLCSVNNMAQIHLLLRKPKEALTMLEDTLNRGNSTLAALYKSIHESNRKTNASKPTSSSRPDSSENTTPAANGSNGVVDDDKDKGGMVDEEDAEVLALQMAEEENDEAARKTRRLRRKLARTLLDIAHVHFFNNHLDKALSRCREAITLVDDHMPGMTLSAAWYNLSLVLHYQGKNEEALSCLENFIRVASGNKLIGPDHVQYGDAYQLKAFMLFDLGRHKECIEPLNEALRIRRLQFGSQSGILVETLGLLGKVYVSLTTTEDDGSLVDKAIVALTECIGIERTLTRATTVPTSTTINENGKRARTEESGEDSRPLSLEAAQTLLDLGRAYQIKGDWEAARSQYGQVKNWAIAFFGAEHVFPERIETLLEKLGQDHAAAMVH